MATARTKRLRAREDAPLSPSRVSDLVREIQRIAPVIGGLVKPDCLIVVMILGEGARTFDELQTQIGQDRQTLSRHLATLGQAGLIGTGRERAQTRYRLTDSGLALIGLVRQVATHDPDASADPVPIPPALLKEVGQVTNDPEGWMRQPNFQFEGRRPVDLLGTPDEPRILRIIKAAQQGFFA